MYHTVGGLVQDDDVGVEEQVARHVQPLPLGCRQVLHPRVLHLRESQVLDQSVDLGEETL